MAEKKSIKKVAAAPNQPKTESLVVNQFNLQSVDRTPKTVESWRLAHRAAEQIQYPNRSRYYDLLKDVELDGYLTGTWGKRVDTVLNKVITFERDNKKVDELDDLIGSNEFREMKKLLMQNISHGLCGMQFIRGEKFDFVEIPIKHIRPETKQFIINQTDQTGIPYEDMNDVWVIGKPYDLGIFLKCSFYALIKKGNFSDWAQYVEIFGQPVRIVKYDAYDNKTKTQLEQVLEESGSSLTLMIPKQAEFEIMDGKTSNGDGQLQERLKTACNEEMGLIILGNTETSSSSGQGGSLAKAKEHGEQQDEITKSDLAYLLNMLNSDKFMDILRSYGYPVDGGRFTAEKEIDLNKLKTRSEIDIKLRESGLPISDDYFYETYNIPKPDDYDAIKAEKSADQEEAPEGEKPKPKPAAKKVTKPLPDQSDKAEGLINFLRQKIADFFDPPQS